ncbi:hypothetical protein OIV83_000199 [Microbotryomycetes sp. JL201]|nr:hypothetical protein OIV83_000199 [Microbotryomycetes sp. JL201]
MSSAESHTLYAGGYLGEIVTLRFTPGHAGSNATLERVGSTSMAGEAPTWLTLSPDSKLLFSTDELGGLLSSFEIERDSLRHLSSIPVGGEWPCHSTLLDSTPRKLLSATYKGQLVTSHTIFSSGDFVPDESYVQRLSVEGVGELGPHKTRQDSRHPHGVHIDPKGKAVVVPDLGTDQLRLFRVLPDGQIEYVIGGETRTEPASGPRHCLFAKSRIGQDVMYVLNELSNSVSVYSVTYDRDESAESLPRFSVLQSSVSLLPPQPTSRQSPFEKWHAAEVKVTPDLRHLIASNRAEDHDPHNGTREGDPDLFATFALRDDGTLDEESKQTVTSFGRAPRHFSLSSESRTRASWKQGDDLYLAVAHHDSDEVVVAQVRDNAELVEVARLQGLARPGVVIWA